MAFCGKEVVAVEIHDPEYVCVSKMDTYCSVAL